MDSQMSREDIIEPDAPPTREERRRIGRLTAEQVALIDRTLLGESSATWSKVARVVGFTMVKVRLPGIPDSFYAERVKLLVESGELLVEGDLRFMRYSEVKLNSNV